MWRSLFGAKAQVVVGALFVLATIFQAIWWGLLSSPSTAAIFWLSIEALLFGAWSVMSNGLTFRATERVEQVVVEQADVDVDVDVDT